ncbi:MAG: NAD-binding protein [Haloglomus sp.]
MSEAIIAGPDPEGLGDALAAEGVTVVRADGTAARDDLLEAGIEDADLFVLTDAGLATAIPIARELNPDVRIVAYTDDSLPEFVGGQEVIAMDPALLGPEAVAEELA